MSFPVWFGYAGTHVLEGGGAGCGGGGGQRGAAGGGERGLTARPTSLSVSFLWDLTKYVNWY